MTSTPRPAGPPTMMPCGPDPVVVKRDDETAEVQWPHGRGDWIACSTDLFEELIGRLNAAIRERNDLRAVAACPYGPCPECCDGPLCTCHGPAAEATASAALADTPEAGQSKRPSTLPAAVQR